MSDNGGESARDKPRVRRDERWCNRVTSEALIRKIEKRRRGLPYRGNRARGDDKQLRCISPLCKEKSEI